MAKKAKTKKIKLSQPKMDMSTPDRTIEMFDRMRKAGKLKFKIIK